MTAWVSTVTDPLGSTDIAASTAAYRRVAGSGFGQAVPFGGIIPAPNETDYAADDGTFYVDEAGVPYLVGP